MNTQPVAFAAFTGLVLAIVVAAGCGTQAGPKAVREAKLPEIPLLQRDQPPILRPPREVILSPGESAAVLLIVDRNGNEGPITAQVHDLPPGITATVEPPVDVDDIVKITIRMAADATLGDVALDERYRIEIAVNDRREERRCKVQVPQVSRPLIPAQDPFLIQPGTTTIWHVPIDRHGFEGAIDFQAAPSADAFTVEAAPVAADQSEVRLRIAVRPDAPDGPATCALRWTSYGRGLSAELPVNIVRRPFSLPLVATVALRPGEERQATLVVERAGHAGPVSLTLDPLPAGVRASPPGLRLESETAVFTFSAADTAPETVAIVPVRASAGHLLATGLIAVRVVGDTARKGLDDALAALPARSRREPVAARRVAAARQALAAVYGSTEESGPAVRQALRWLASRQAGSGEWQAVAEGAAAPAGGSVAVTALALLPFLAEGVTHEPDPARPVDGDAFAEVVKQGLLFLGNSQPVDGEQAGAIGTTMDAHLFGLMAFSEAFALSDEDDLKTRAKLAADRLIRFQGKQGEWAVAGGQQARDTALAAVALQVARSCGIGVVATSLRKAAQHLDTYATLDQPRGARFSAAPGLPADAELTALCLLAKQGAAPGDAPEIVAGGDFIAGFAPAVGAARIAQPPLFLVIAGEALRTLEGERYDAWNAAVRSFLTARQVREGELAGSWDPAIFGGSGDRVWATACAALCLQAHFRNLPPP
jgi:hypothetical protein